MSNHSVPATSSAFNDLINCYKTLSPSDQLDFVEQILTEMCHNQHTHIHAHLESMLKRDFISLLPDIATEKVLSYLDADSLKSGELVCKKWYEIISVGAQWKLLFEHKVRTDSLWYGLAERRNLIQYLSTSRSGAIRQQYSFYRSSYIKVSGDIKRLNHNWRNGKYILKETDHAPGNAITSCDALQFDDHKIVCAGLVPDYNNIEIRDINNLECTKTLVGHTAPVMCLQYDDKIIISGTMFIGTICVWDVVTGDLLNTLTHHTDGVNSLRFNDSILVSCSNDCSIDVWNLRSPTDIVLRTSMFCDDRVTAIALDDNYIVSACAITITVWNSTSGELVRNLDGHRGCIFVLEYRDNLVVSGGDDHSIRLWDINLGTCLRVLWGHEQYISCVRFDTKRIISADGNEVIKVWDLNAALDRNEPASALCTMTFELEQIDSEEKRRVASLKFDEFQIVCGSYERIMVLDFLKYSSPEP